MMHTVASSRRRPWRLVGLVAIAMALLPLGIVQDAQAAKGPYVLSCKTKGAGYKLKERPRKFVIDCARLDVRAKKLNWVKPNKAKGVLVVEEAGYQRVTHKRRAVFRFREPSIITAKKTAYKKLVIKHKKPLNGSKKSVWNLRSTTKYTPTCIYTWDTGPVDKLCHDAPR